MQKVIESFTEVEELLENFTKEPVSEFTKGKILVIHRNETQRLSIRFKTENDETIFESALLID